MKRRELLVGLFEACNSWKSVAQLHAQTLKAGVAHDSFFATKLVVLYGEHASIRLAQRVLDETPQKTAYLWNATLRGYCRAYQWEETLYLFHNMVCNGSVGDEKPDNFTIPIALKACAGLRALECGKMVHGFVKKNDKICSDVYVGSALIEFYSKCKRMNDAFKVFKEYSKPDVFLWTSMVTGYEQNGSPEEALSFFSQMVVAECASPDIVTLVSVVSACAQLSNIKIGCCIQGFVIKKGFDADLPLANSFLNLYAKTGYTKEATNLFRKMPDQDVISWSTMVACYAHNGPALEALVIFNEMITKKIDPNSITLVNAVQACAVACNLEEGRKIHELAIKKGFELDISVSTALIDMYMKCFTPNKAVDIFERMPNKDVVAYAALLSGFAYNGMAYKSMGVFRNMLLEEMRPDAVAMVKILAACSELGILQQALCLHGYVEKSGFYNNIFIGASLMELYSKCGSIDNAMKVFEAMVNKDVVIWSAMIAAYAIHGQGEEALKFFQQMIRASTIRPNEVTFLSVLSACSHSGLVEEGIEIFNMMLQEYQLRPNSEHFGILVDLLGRRGELDQAMEIIKQMPVPAGPHVWGALLGACRIHHHVKLGEFAAKNLFQLDPNHGGYYILLANMYAVDQKWDSMAEIRTLIKEKKLKKMLGQSVIDAGNGVYSFVADDKLHPDSNEIYDVLSKLEARMREVACVPCLEHLVYE